MICNVEQPDGSLKQVEATPVCGEDFCDECGDCLGCGQHAEAMEGEHEWCKSGGMWVVYLHEDRNKDGVFQTETRKTPD